MSDVLYITIILFVAVIWYTLGDKLGYKKGYNECEEAYKKHVNKMEKIAYERGVEVGKNYENNKVIISKLTKKYNLH